MDGELDIRRLTPASGAEVHGLDLSEPLAPSTVANVRAALCRHLVLFFPRQELSPDQQAAFARQFGQPTEAHPIMPALDDHPHVLPIDSRRNKSNFWHSDVTFMSRPPMGSILYAVLMPEVGGDTLWVSLQAAYDALAEPVRDLCDRLIGLHWDPSFAAEIEAAGGCTWAGKRIERLRPVVHPVVRVHPETGRKGLFVNQNFTTLILEVSPIESDGLLRMLFQHCQLPEFSCRYRWQQGTVAFWDNRASLHYATDDYGDALRIVHRVTLQGDRPYGPAMPARSASEPAAVAAG
ncbi:MAG TPA: TauD/TfdA family dioxygenase [Acidimicrobiales bacterium]|nr:TauD/TfdA family dioxygenase [Acidimicrobiales bacterium]